MIFYRLKQNCIARKNIFQKNGSIIDATIATMFCAGLTNMQSMGIGGGFIMNVYIKKHKKAYTLDAREISAKKATEDMHLHDPSTTNEGPLSIATPGELKGYWEAHQRFGKLPWREILQPSIDICNNGFPMSKHMYDSLHINWKVKLDQQLRVRWDDSIPVNINGDTMYVIPPPGSGILLSFIVNILRNYNFGPESLSTVNATILTYHRIIEAFKHSYGKRTMIGDPKFVSVDELVRNLTSPDYAEQIRMSIDDNKTKPDYSDYGGQFYIKDSHGTAHISLLGPNGDAVSITSSVNFYFGAALTGSRTGIIMNSGMDDFSSPGLKNYFGLPGTERNYIRPQKRAISSMSPTIIVGSNGNVKLVVGAAGGTKITTAVAMIIMKILWFGKDIKEAVDTPRIHHQLIPMALQYEFGNLEIILRGLQAKGHSIHRYRERGSIVCGIAQNKTGVYANADFRKGGEVSGF
ncbi:glutathione hydrolase 1 proenzyme-like isoform X3 [Wyeomyia smithii]|uniref:glutathione hydrolase 1 proenzyme-like isoform X3 n=1 Tax=Wyeomyia smithii TaxID=174621 RepID=UPI002467BDE3|nr:glutathione hydrolase 1 proenzyme-like isoform X3 [Wyeomyia smithii]